MHVPYQTIMKMNILFKYICKCSLFMNKITRLYFNPCLFYYCIKNTKHMIFCLVVYSSHECGGQLLNGRVLILRSTGP